MSFENMVKQSEENVTAIDITGELKRTQVKCNQLQKSVDSLYESVRDLNRRLDEQGNLTKAVEDTAVKALIAQESMADVTAKAEEFSRTFEDLSGADEFRLQMKTYIEETVKDVESKKDEQEDLKWKRYARLTFKYGWVLALVVALLVLSVVLMPTLGKAVAGYIVAHKALQGLIAVLLIAGLVYLGAMSLGLVDTPSVKRQNREEDRKQERGYHG